MHLIRDERGAAALLIAAGMVLFLGMAAMVVDLGLAFNERRQDQTAVDSGAMAGALHAGAGVSAMRAEALDYVRTNLPTSYSSEEWKALWEGCVDPAAARNEGGAFNFLALPAPDGWVVTDPDNWCISADTALGLLRVRAPKQIVEAAFGRILGVDELRTDAAATARIYVYGDGGILPFGLGAGADGHVCLSAGPAGISDPCDPASGNFGTLIGWIWGNNDDIPTTGGCRKTPTGDVLAENIAHGLDHIVLPDPTNDPGSDRDWQCSSPFPNTLQTDTGFPNVAGHQGLAGPVPGGFTPRLAQGDDKTVFTYDVDKTPLWSFLNLSANYGGLVPAVCDPNGLQGFLGTGESDWDNDITTPDTPDASWLHKEVCLDQYVDGPYTGIMFEPSLALNSARFGYVPEFWESSLGSGSTWLPIHSFRAVYLQTTLWKKNNPGTAIIHSPGEGCVDLDGLFDPCVGTGFRIIQLTAFVLPDLALPVAIRGEEVTPGSGVNPFRVELFR